jgi:putative ABC transport system permease protein
MTGALRDVIYAWRGLTERPGFFVASLLTLAIGIGANVTIFSLVNGIALRPMPFGDRTERLVTMHPTHRLLNRGPGWGHSEISFRDLLDFRTATTVEGIGAYLTRTYVLSGDTAMAERLRGGAVTPDLFPLLGIDPFLGRHFREDEAARPGLETVVMLTHDLWQRRYNADPTIVGRSIVVNDRPRVVVGVLPPGVRFPERDEIYAPLGFDQTPRSAREVNAVALLRAGVTIEQARAEMDTIAAGLEAAYPDTNRGFGVQVLPLRRSFVGPDSTRLALVLMAAVAFVLLIMCANLANLLLARGVARQREIAVRSAMGATRRRLMWIAFSESVVIVVPGAALGLLLSQWGIDAVAALPMALPYWVEIRIDARVLVFAFGATLFTTLAVGMLPSLRATRTNLVSDLKEGARGTSMGRAAHRVQSALVVVQVALCFGLLVGANLMVRSFLEMRRAGIGFDPRPIVSAGGYLAGEAFTDVSTRAAFFRNVTTTLAALPGASAAAIISAIPGDDGGSGRRLVTDERMGEDDDIVAEAVAIGPSLFDVIGVRLLEGRPFTEQETENPDADVAVLNERLARQLWPGSSALDRRIGFRGDQGVRWLRVIGIAPDIHYREIGRDTEQSRLTVYIPYAMEGSRSMAMLVRTDGAADSLVAPVRDAMEKAGPTFAISRVMAMQELRRLTTWQEQLFGNLMAAFAAAALLLACLGIYALIAYSVGRRSHEIGVRLALGARPADVIHMLVRETAAVGGTGLLAGFVLALMIARALVGTLYGVSFDAWLFVSMALPLTFAILVATWLPARRAARVEPTVALRDE